MSVLKYIALVSGGVVLLAAFAWWRAVRQHAPCPVWLHWMVEIENPFTKISRSAVVVQHLDIQPGMTVLDIGCGPGRVTLPLARAVGPQGIVVAMDLQPGMLRLAQDKAQAANLTNIQFLQGGVGEGKLEHNRADRAVMVTVLGEIHEQEAALQEIYDALKPGGMLSITEIIFDPDFQKRDKVFQLANAVGFKEKDFFGNSITYTLNLEKPAP